MRRLPFTSLRATVDSNGMQCRRERLDFGICFSFHILPVLYLLNKHYKVEEEIERKRG